jgi:uncharacterized protein YjiS (DUF1127 family)
MGSMSAYALHKGGALFRGRQGAQLAGMRLILLRLSRLVREAVLYIGASPQSRRHQLEALGGLDDHLLRDIGLDRSVAADGRTDHGTSPTGV